MKYTVTLRNSQIFSFDADCLETGPFGLLDFRERINGVETRTVAAFPMSEVSSVITSINP